jgi:heme exporter protein D
MARPKSELGDIRTSARSVRLLRWLRREPLPAKVVGETDDGDETSCAVAGKSTKQLHDVISVVRGCTEFKALDKDGNELRRLTLDPSDPELRAEAEAAAVKSLAAAGGGNGSVPIISVDLPKLVDNIARNIREASSEAARQSAHAHRGGYDAMISVVNVALNLLVGVENRLQSLQDEQQRQQRHQQQGEPDPAAKRQELAMLALQKAVGGNGSSNGNGGGGVMELMKFMQAMKDAPSGETNDAS